MSESFGSKINTASAASAILIAIVSSTWYLAGVGERGDASAARMERQGAVLNQLLKGQTDSQLDVAVVKEQVIAIKDQVKDLSQQVKTLASRLDIGDQSRRGQSFFKSPKVFPPSWAYVQEPPSIRKE